MEPGTPVVRAPAAPDDLVFMTATRLNFTLGIFASEDFIMGQAEQHRTNRVGWLRAAVLGANDGIVSTASLIVGVAAAESTRNSVLIAGIAGLVAGAMSMAAGEYVSVSSQSDTESADLHREREELATDGEREHAELAAIYVARGLDANLAALRQANHRGKNCVF